MPVPSDRTDIESRLAALAIETRPFIAGRHVDPIADGLIAKLSSIDGRELPALPACGDGDVDAAVAAARECHASGAWRDTEPAQRGAVLRRLAELMGEHAEELALLDTLETGRAVRNYLEDSIPKAIDVVRWYGEASDKYFDRHLPARADSLAWVERVPLGVVGAITPWNDPLVPAAWKFAPALAMGNVVVLKPAEQSSYSMLRVAALAVDAGLPAGALNVVPGYGQDAGRALALHDDVAGIFFTGSATTGKLVLQYAGLSNLKKVGLELGGKSPFIVSRHCSNLGNAARTLAQNVFYNQGQICSAPSRAMVHADIFDAFLDTLLQAASDFVPNHPLDPATEVGCMVSAEQRQRAERYIEEGRKLAAHTHELPGSGGMPSGSQYCNPVILEDLPADAAAETEEIFGPVLSLSSFRDMDEAVRRANSSRYGLAAAVFSDQLDEAHRVARQLEAGIVHVNSYGDDDITAPFGGIKGSGIGRDKSLLAFDEYSEAKTTWMRLSGHGDD